MRKIYRVLRIKSRKWADFWVNTVFAILMVCVGLGSLIYILVSGNMRSGNAGWDKSMMVILVAGILFALILLYVLIKQRIKKDWKD